MIVFCEVAGTLCSSCFNHESNSSPFFSFKARESNDMVLAWFIITTQKYTHGDTLLHETKTENLTDQKNLYEDTSTYGGNGPT
jgi:hypothetical protein